MLHVYNPTDILPFVVTTVNVFFKIPFIFHIADPWPEGVKTIFKSRLVLKFSQILESYVIKRSSALITVSDYLKKVYKETRENYYSAIYIYL